MVSFEWRYVATSRLRVAEVAAHDRRAPDFDLPDAVLAEWNAFCPYDAHLMFEHGPADRHQSAPDYARGAGLRAKSACGPAHMVCTPQLPPGP